MSENTGSTPDNTPEEGVPSTDETLDASVSSDTTHEVSSEANESVTTSEKTGSEESSPAAETTTPEAAVSPVAGGATGASLKDEGGKKKKKLLIILGAIIAAVALVVGVLYFTGKDDKTKEPAAAVAAAPIAKGKFIIVPDNLDGGKPNSDKKIGDPVKDDTAPKYADPSNLSDYRIVKEDGSVLLKSPLDGPCALNALGNVLPPSNYMHSCYYEKNGAVIYTSHAVIGNRTGALENIQYLKAGQIVTLDGVEYKVTRVGTFDANNLPEYLLKKGTVSLLTCHIDSSTKTFEDFTKTDVAFLEKK